MCTSAATSQNNMDASNVCASVHFNMASSLLEVSLLSMLSGRSINSLYKITTWHTPIFVYSSVRLFYYLAGGRGQAGGELDTPILPDQQRERDQAARR